MDMCGDKHNKYSEFPISYNKSDYKLFRNILFFVRKKRKDYMITI
jgi:hypothetical protein